MVTRDDEAGVSLAKDQPPPEAQGPVADGENPLDAFLAGSTYGVLALLGFVVGVIGSFGYDWTIGAVPVAAMLLVVLTTGGVWLAGWAMGGRLGAVIPWSAWMAVVVLLSTGRPEGDLIISANRAGYVFIIGGMVAGGIAIALVRPARPAGSWLLGQGVRSPR